jgi:maltose O-acetyltransferase
VATEKERMLAGEPYLADDPELLADRHRCRLGIERLNAIGVAEPREREAILRGLLGGLGEQTEILSPFHCDYGYQIVIGARSFINFSAVILDSAPVRIGDDVQIGPGVRIVTPTHPLGPDERRTRIESAAPITICDDAWLATGAIVLPGVTVGQGTVVAAGSVVTKDLPARHLCIGSPCRPVREL